MCSELMELQSTQEEGTGLEMRNKKLKTANYRKLLNFPTVRGM